MALPLDGATSRDGTTSDVLRTWVKLGERISRAEIRDESTAAVEPAEPGQLAEAERGCEQALAQEHPPHVVAQVVVATTCLHLIVYDDGFVCELVY